MTRPGVLLVYAVILGLAAIIAAVLQPGSRSPYYTTRASMLPNHLVQAAELEAPKAGKVQPPLVGRYARRFVDAGERVSEESFSALPSLRDVRLALLVPVLRSAITSGVDAGRSIRVCVANKPIGTTRAQAMFCETGAVACRLLVDATPQLLSAIDVSRLDSLHAVAENVACP